MARIINYTEVAANFALEPLEAIKHFIGKGLRPSYAWQDMLAEEHDTAFTVAKMMDTDLLATVQGRVERAIADGTTLDQFKKELIPQLQQAGWWGKKDTIDPLTGLVSEAQLGSASRLETIFRSNLQSSYAAGHWQSIEANARTAPYLMYDAVDDHRTRPEHAALDGKVYPVSDAFWREHFPPGGWNCRCGVIQLDDDDIRDMGLTIEKNPAVERRPWANPRTGITRKVSVHTDPGWDHNPGLARSERLTQNLRDKAKKLPGQQRRAVQRALERKAISVASYTKGVAAGLVSALLAWLNDRPED